MYSVLLIVDLQLDFCEGGALAVPGAQDLVVHINKILADYDFVIATQDWHPAHHISFASQHENLNCFEQIKLEYGDQVLWPDHCVQGTQGAALHPLLDQSQVNTIVRKGYRQHVDSYSAFFENDHKTPTMLGALLCAPRCKIDICGVAREYCVEYTYQDALKLGYQAQVLENLCAGFTN